MKTSAPPPPDPSLRAVGLDDLPLFREAFARGRQQGWVHYFPFLYFFNQGRNRELLFYEDHGAICLFLHKWHDNPEKRPSLDLYVPPFPMQADALHRACRLIGDYNGEGRGRIVWIDDKEAAIVENSGFGFQLHPLGEEYIYDPRRYEDISGSAFRNLRQNIMRAKRYDNLTVEPYSIADAGECLQLLDLWHSQQAEKIDHLDDAVYTRTCLQMADHFLEPDLIGRVVKIDGRIRAFGFFGRMYDGMGNGFIGKADHTVTGLLYYLLYHLMRDLADFDRINNASDQGRPGLQFAKRMLRPVAMHAVFRANLVHKRQYLPTPALRDTPVRATSEIPQEFFGNALEGLREISAADRNDYQAALELSTQRTILNFFPWLLSFSASPDRSILLGREEGSLCVYLLHHSTDRNRLHLYLPPLPMSEKALAACLARLNRYNGNRRGRLWWIDETVTEAVAATGLFSLRPALEEFIYAPQTYDDLGGAAGSKLRYQLRRAMAAGEITVRPCRLDDLPHCLDLLDGWRRERSASGLTVRNFHALKAALYASSRLPVGDLQGIVVEVNGRLRACALGGRLVGDTACSLLNITDHGVPSLGYYTRYAYFKSLAGFREINDGDAGRKELALVKKTLLPTRIARVHTGTQTQREEPAGTRNTGTLELDTLRHVTPEDLPVFRRCLDQAGKEAWPTFFPFLCSRTGQNGSLRWEMYRGSICLYTLEQTASGPRLHLFMPPFPFRISTLTYALARMALCNGNEASRISWVDGQEQEMLLRSGFTVNITANEQIFTRQQLLERADRLPRPPGLITRPYDAADRDACLKVLEAWLEHFRSRGGRGSGAYFKRFGLHTFLQFPEETLTGEVLEVGGTVCGYCFGGLIRPGLASILATVCHPDHEVGIPMLQASFARRNPARQFNLGDPEIGMTGGGDHPRPEPFRRQVMYRALRHADTSRRRSFATRDINTAIFILAARELGLDVQIISASYSCCIISDGSRKLYVYHNTTGITDVATRRMTNHKYLSQSILRDNDIPVPQARQFECGDIESILSYAASRRPVVIKPVKGSNSVGVTIDPQGEEGIREAVAAITKGRVMVEDFIAGDAYRILIHNGRIVDILRWSPPFVVGNGIDSVHLLVEEKDTYREARNLPPIAVDTADLRRQDLELDSVPAAGRKVLLHHLVEPAVGEEPERVQIRTVHPDNLEMFVRAAEASGLPLAGLDFLSPDPGISYRTIRSCVNEINSTPHIWPHFVADQADDLGPAKAVLAGHFGLSTRQSRPDGDKR